MEDHRERVRAQDTPDGVDITIAPSRAGLPVHAMVSVMFSLGIAAAVHGLATGTGFGAPGRHGEPAPTGFMAFWVLGASVGVAASLRKIAWMLGGRETLSLRGHTLRLERSDPLRRVVRSFDVADVRALREGEAPEKLPASEASMGLGKNGVVFDHRGRTEGFGLDLAADDARAIVQRLQAALRERGEAGVFEAPEGPQWIRETRDGLEIELTARHPTGKLAAVASSLAGLVATLALALWVLKPVLSAGPFAVFFYGIVGFNVLHGCRALNWRLRGREVLRLTRSGLDYERLGDLPLKWHVAPEALDTLAVRPPPEPTARRKGAVFSLGEPRLTVAGRDFGIALDVVDARTLVERVARTRAMFLASRGFRDDGGAPPPAKTG